MLSKNYLNKNLDGLNRAREEFDNMFDKMLQGFGVSTIPMLSNPSIITTPMDVVENNKNVEVFLDVPGVEQKDIKIVVDKNTLIISGTKEETVTETERTYRSSERYYGSFRREVYLSECLDTNNISAEMKNGTLKVTIPKIEQMIQDSPKTIPIIEK